MRTRIVGIALLSTLAFTIPARAAATSADAPVDLRAWSEGVWSSAIQGDRSELDRLFERVPSDAAPENARRFGELLTQHNANQSATLARRQDDLAAAQAKLQELIVKGDLSLAMREAVNVQYLSGDFAAVLQDPDVQTLIAQAREKVPQAEADGDWLLAQELLYRLRTLYEDAGHPREFQEYHEHLSRVNRRVSLLADYAPRRLHELRNRADQRQGREPTEFNPGRALDWREHIDGIDHRMLRQALRVAAAEHIEDAGWRPLLEGGLEAMRLLATTPDLAETFPSIGDAAMVDAWIREVDQLEADMNRRAGELLDSRDSDRILHALWLRNDETLHLPREVIFREFGDGAAYRLDEFTEVIWPDNLRRFKQQTEGNFVGVGVLISHNDKRELVVVNPLEGTPAYFQGVKPNDLIVEVDGQSTVGWSLNDAVDRITGPKDTNVTLGVRREGVEDIVKITIERDLIKIHSVRGWWKERLDDHGDPVWNWFIDPVSRIAYVKLTQFSDDTYNDLLRAWRDQIMPGKPAGLILDLRYNPGGMLTSAVQISNLFVERGVIVSGEDKSGRKAWEDQRSDPTRAFIAESGVPVVLLVNQGSASASEIVAGCLQAHDKAVVIGERTYGKGSVQTVHSIASNALLKLTTQYYRLPPSGEAEIGRLVHKRPGATEWGVDPDLVVKMTPDQIEKSLEFRRDADILPEDRAAGPDGVVPVRPDINDLLIKGLDPQLETALLILQARALGAADAEPAHARLP